MNASDHLKKSMHIKIIQQTFGKKKMFFLKILLQGTGKNWKPLSLCITPVYALWTTAHNTVTACTGG